MPALTSEQARRVYDRIGRAQDWQRFGRPVRLVDVLDPPAWDVRHRATVVAWGIVSEVVIAARR